MRQWPLHSCLTWAICEVVKAAVLGPDAVLITVACPIHPVHPPVSGETAQVSASAAFAQTTTWHDIVSQSSYQQTGELHKRSHHELVRLEDKPCSSTLSYELLQEAVKHIFLCSFPLLSHSTSVMIMRGRGWNTRSAQPSPARSLPCHRIPCDLEFLCPDPLFTCKIGLQRNLQYQTTTSDRKTFSLMLCVHPLSLSLSLFPAEHLPAVSVRDWREGRGEPVSLVYLAHWVSFLFLNYFLPVPYLFTFCLLTTPVQNYCASLTQSLSATPNRCVSTEKKECELLAGLQSVVPGGPLSLVKPSGSHLSPLIFSFFFRLL